MLNRITNVFLLFLLLAINAAPLVDAQSPLPDIDLVCDGSVNIDVRPGSTLTAGYICTVTNNSSFNNEVDIVISSDEFEVSGPGTISVPPVGETEFQVMVRGDAGYPAGSSIINVEATVVETNGVPPPTMEQEDYDTMVTILQYGKFSVSSSTSQVSGGERDKISLRFDVKNEGNEIDFARGMVSEWSRDELDEYGFIINMNLIKLQIDYGDTEAFIVELTLPTWESFSAAAEANGEELYFAPGESFEIYFNLEFAVESEFTCRSWGCERESLIVTIEFSGYTEEESIFGTSSNTMFIVGGGISLVVLLIAGLFVVLKKPKVKSKPKPSIKEQLVEEKVVDEFDFL
jgi:hypothetical protein